jgi:hypothetical protein
MTNASCPQKSGRENNCPAQTPALAAAGMFFQIKKSSAIPIRETKGGETMKKIVSILVAMLFAWSLSGMSFATEPAVPAPEQPKIEEKAPATDEAKEMVEKKVDQKAEQATETKQEAAPAPDTK